MRIGCNAVGHACQFSAARGEYVEIMVNIINVILVVRDTRKINTTSTVAGMDLLKHNWRFILPQILLMFCVGAETLAWKIALGRVP